jgi:hypothetical protein
VGRTTSSTITSFGTTIQAAGSGFGGVQITASGSLAGCTTVTITGGSGSGAAASVITGRDGNKDILTNNFGEGYGTALPTSVTIAGSGCSATGTASLVTTVVFIGDSNVVPGNTFGSRLENLTVDCHYLTGCSGIEIQNAQEQSGPRYVNAVNWAVRGIFVHGTASINSSITDVEVDGCYSPTSCKISGTSVGVEIDNTAVRVDKLTANAVNTASFTPSSASCSSPDVTLNGTLSTSIFNSGYVLIAGVSGSGPSVNGIWPIVSSSPSSLKYSVSPGTCSGSYTVTGATATILPLEAVSVCSGITCADNAAAGVISSVIFTGIKHTERAHDGIYVTGPVSYTDMSPTCPSAGATMSNCIHLAGGANTPNSVSITDLLVAGGANVSVQDDNLSRTITSSTVSQYSIGYGCPVNTGILAYTPQGNVTMETGQSAAALFTLPTPGACQIPPGACMDLDVGFQHPAGTTPTDYALLLYDSASTAHVIGWLIAQGSTSHTLYTFNAHFCNNPGSQSQNSSWITTMINGGTYFALPTTMGNQMFSTSGLLTTSPPLQLVLWVGADSCTFTSGSTSPFSCTATFTSSDTFRLQFARMTLVQQQ